VVIRPYAPEDRGAILALREAHGQDDFFFADPDHALNFATIVVEDDGRLVAAVTGRLVVEGFLMLDPTYSTPLGRWRMLKSLFRAGFKKIRESGLSECLISVPLVLGSYAGLLAKLPYVNKDERYRFFVPIWKMTE
jgi:hypothetical protein